MAVNAITKAWAKQQRINSLLFFTETGSGSCNLGCSYCEPAGTRLLTGDAAWKPIEEIQTGDVLVGFRPAEERGKHTRYALGVVTGTATRRAPVYRIVTSRGEVRATGDHLWWTKGRRWRRTDRLRSGWHIGWVSQPIDPPDTGSEDYAAGYVMGVGLGDGTLGHYEYPYQSVHQFRLAVKDREILNRTEEYLTRLGVQYRRRSVDLGPRNSGSVTEAIFVQGVHRVAVLEPFLNQWRDTDMFRRGFLAGIFDAEGSYDGNALRIHNGGVGLLERAAGALESLSIAAKIEQPGNRTVGAIAVSNRPDVIRFVAATQPVCRRKFASLWGGTLYGTAEVLAVEPQGEETVYSVETSTGTYISEGLASHNCFLAKHGIHKVMTVETLHAALDFLREIATKDPYIHFFGTEPLKRFDLIQEARRYAPEMPISLTTNGTLLTRERLEWMAQEDVKIYVFSIDGGEEHNALRVDRHGRPAWERIKRGLQLALEYQSQWLTARGSWYPSDYDLVSRFKALEELGAKSIQMVPVNSGPFDEEKAMEAYLALGEYYKWGWTPSKFVNDMVKRMRNEEAVPQEGNSCGVGSGYWAVSPDGRLSLCQLYEESPELAIGDIWNGITNPEPLWNIGWRVDTFHKPENPYPKPQCRTCTAYKHCMGVGFCAGLNKQDTGDELVPPDGYCNHLRGLVRAARIWAEKMGEKPEGKVLKSGVLSERPIEC